MQNYSSPQRMKKVGDLFEKYKLNIKAPQATVEKACAKSIFKISGIKVDEKKINYNVTTQTISLNLPSVVKSELGFYKKEIINELCRELGGTKPETIL